MFLKRRILCRQGSFLLLSLVFFAMTCLFLSALFQVLILHQKSLKAYMKKEQAVYLAYSGLAYGRAHFDSLPLYDTSFFLETPSFEPSFFTSTQIGDVYLVKTEFFLWFVFDSLYGQRFVFHQSYSYDKEGLFFYKIYRFF